WQSLHSMAAAGGGATGATGAAANAFPTNLFSSPTSAGTAPATSNLYHFFMNKFPQLYNSLYDMNPYSQYLHLLKTYQSNHHMTAAAALAANGHFNATSALASSASANAAASAAATV